MIVPGLLSLGAFGTTGCVQNQTSADAPRIEVTPPRFLTPGAVLAIYASGFLLAIVIFGGCVLALSLKPLSVWTLLIPLLTAGAFVFLLPVGFEHLVVMRLVRSLPAAPAAAQDSFIVQLTLSPRLRTGLRSLLEDADDIGRLSFRGSKLIFEGDSVRLTVPFCCLETVRARNIGFRRVFVYGPRIEAVVSGLPNVAALEFAERSSWVLPGSRKTTRKLHARLVAAAKPAA